MLLADLHVSIITIDTADGHKIRKSETCLTEFVKGKPVKNNIFFTGK